MARVLNVLAGLICALVEAVISPIPGGLGQRLRYAYYRRRLKNLGKNVRFGVGVRIYSPDWVRIGDHCWIDDYVIIVAGPPANGGRFIYRKLNPLFSFQEGELVIGDYVHIAPFCLIQAHGGVVIGNSTGVAAGSKIHSLSHHYRDLTHQGAPNTVWKFSPLVPPREQALICAPVVLQDNAAVGANCVVLPGSVLGSGSWLGANSLLRGVLPPGVIASGVPAAIVKIRFP